MIGSRTVSYTHLDVYKRQDKDIAKPNETPAVQEKTTKEQDAPSEPVDREENKSEPVVEKQEQKETKHDAKPAPAATEKSQSSSDVTLKTKPVDETDKQTQPSKPKENKHQSNNRAQENSQQGNRQNQSRPVSYTHLAVKIVFNMIFPLGEYHYRRGVRCSRSFFFNL